MLVCCGDNPTKGAYDALRLWKQLAQTDFKGELHWFGRMEADFERRVRTLPDTTRIHLYGRGRGPRFSPKRHVAGSYLCSVAWSRLEW